MWQPDLPTSELMPGSLKVWRAPLTPSQEQYAHFCQLLSPDEHQRAQRFKFPEHRERYVAAHGILRTLLSRHVTPSAAEIEFIYSSRGKPSLNPSIQNPKQALYFNISHSGDWGLFALAHHPIGVDLEAIRTVDAVALARRFFAPNEIQFLTELPNEEQLSGFYQLWTGKEAFLKATGDGITGLSQITLEKAFDSSLTLSSWNGEPVRERWSFWSFVPQTNFWGALAAAASNCQAEFFDYHLR